ncbi:yeats family-domain-containing protein [Globomyces pollinis-pini]|nr:yeats family-domain-containing protein [Globomyces pollinis-pini]
MQGFVNHCRIVHQLEFPSHGEAANRCGMKIDESILPSNHPVHRMEAKSNPLPIPLSFSLMGAKPKSEIEAPKIKEYDEEIDMLDMIPMKNLNLAPIYHDSQDCDDEVLPDAEDQTMESDDNDSTTFDASEIQASSDQNGAKTGSRFHIKKLLVVGNSSRYIGNSDKNLDTYQYRWMIYLNGTTKEDTENMQKYIRKVRFFLHPDFRPNDIIDVEKPPYHLSRYGWGECPVRLQIHFHDSRNLPINIIHVLKLDHYKTGRHVKGIERKLEIELDRNTKFLTDDDIETLEMKQLILSELPKERADLSEEVEFDPDTCLWLENICKRFPIIVQESMSDIRFNYSTAKSLQEYMSWTMGKRKATEFQRARLIRQHLQIRLPDSNIRTKTVILWCRAHGFTPVGMIKGKQTTAPIAKGFCKVCGLLHTKATCPPIFFNSFTPFDLIYNSDFPTERREEIIELDTPVQELKKLILPELFNLANLKLIVSANELNWITNTIESIQTPNSNLSQSAACIVVLAVKIFLRRLLSNSIKKYRSHHKEFVRDAILVPPFIYDSIKDFENMSFLRNHYFSAIDS